MAALPLHIEERGEGLPLLLLHGFTGSAAAWPEAVCAELARSFRLLRVDLLGHGHSPKPHEAEAYALNRILDSLVDALDRRQIERAVWIGYSMGGRVALGAAVQRPERVSGLVLEGASPGLQQPHERAARMEADEHLAHRLESEDLEAFVDGWMSQPLFRSQQMLGPETLAQERTRRLANDPRALAACLRGLGTGVQPPLWDSLQGIGVPALIVVGELDEKFQAIAARFAPAIKHARIERIPGAGHTTHLERPQAYASAVSAFVDRLNRTEGVNRDEGGLEARP